MGVTEDERDLMAAELERSILKVLDSQNPPRHETIVAYTNMTFMSSLMQKFAPAIETEGVRFAEGDDEIEGLFQKTSAGKVLIATKVKYLRRPAIYVHYTCRQYVDWLALSENECSRCLGKKFKTALEHISSLVAKETPLKGDAP